LTFQKDLKKRKLEIKNGNWSDLFKSVMKVNLENLAYVLFLISFSEHLEGVLIPQCMLPLNSVMVGAMIRQTLNG
jgi:hypothetical protein